MKNFISIFCPGINFEIARFRVLAARIDAILNYNRRHSIMLIKLPSWRVSMFWGVINCSSSLLLSWMSCVFPLVGNFCLFAFSAVTMFQMNLQDRVKKGNTTEEKSKASQVNVLGKDYLDNDKYNEMYYQHEMNNSKQCRNYYWEITHKSYEYWQQVLLEGIILTLIEEVGMSSHIANPNRIPPAQKWTWYQNAILAGIIVILVWFLSDLNDLAFLHLLRQPSLAYDNHPQGLTKN